MRRFAAVGVVAVLLGLVALVEHTLAGVLPLEGPFVTGVGALAVLAGLQYARTARSTARRTATVDAPEHRHRSRVLGEDVDAALEASGRTGTARRVELQRRVRDVAVDALVTRGRYDRGDAVRAVEEGTWTEDPVAAGYLADPEALPRRWRARQLLRPRSTARACVVRSLDAIAEVRAS
jgi:hypothetical protein